MLILLMLLTVGVSADTIGIQNNNPGNVRPFRDGSHCCFKGAIGRKNNYLVFKTPAFGIRAIVINLKIYSKRHHIDTVEGIIHRWTHTEASKAVRDNYARKIREHIGGKPNDKINLWNWRTLYGITVGIIEFENGRNPYDLATYKKVFPLLTTID